MSRPRNSRNEPQRSALIVYDGLPVSSGGAHGLGKRDPSDVWTKLSGFLRECTDPIGPYKIDVLVYETVDNPLPAIEAAKTSAAALFGASQRRGVVTGVVDIAENSWTLDEQQLRRGLRWLSERAPAPSLTTGPPFVIGVEARFRLKDPHSGQVLPLQGPEHYGHQNLGTGLPLGLSSLYARLAVRSTCSLTLCLPFTDVSPALLRCVAALQECLPFKFSAEHWARSQLNAARSRYYPRKIRLPPA